MTSATKNYQRRRLLRILQAEDTSRREVVEALQGIRGLERWMHAEAFRAGQDPVKLETALARLGFRWARHAVKRFFLSPSHQRSPAARNDREQLATEHVNQPEAA